MSVTCLHSESPLLLRCCHSGFLLLPICILTLFSFSFFFFTSSHLQKLGIMPPRGYVLVFFCWALLTVITPTLISWSAAQAKKNAGIVGGATTELKVNRRTMGSYPESSHEIKNRTLTTTPVQAPYLAPASASAPAPTPTSELAPAPQPASVQLSVNQTNSSWPARVR